MGAIVGGAVGSVLGLVFAPKKGEDTRKFLKEKGKELIGKGLETSRNIHELAPQKMSFWRWLFLGRKRKSKQKSQETKPIPHE